MLSKNCPARSGFRAVIFDLDGTTADTFPDLRLSMNTMLRTCSYPERTDAQLMELVNFGVHLFVGHSLPERLWGDESEIARCTKIYNDFYDGHFCTETRLFPGIAESLRRIKDAGIKLAIDTNKEEYQAKEITDILIPGAFDLVVGLGRFAPKPDPESALYIASELGFSPSEIMFVGDSDVDMKTASAAGMYPVGVSWGYRKPEVLRESGAEQIVSSAYELEKLAQGIAV